jgi:hypothetical protein
MISQSIYLIGRSHRIRTSSRPKDSRQLKGKLAALVRHTGRRSINMTKPPLRPRNASFAIGQRAEPPQNVWSRQQTAPTSILGCESLCDVRMGALKRFA